MIIVVIAILFVLSHFLIMSLWEVFGQNWPSWLHTALKICYGILTAAFFASGLLFGAFTIWAIPYIAQNTTSENIESHLIVLFTSSLITAACFAVGGEFRKIADNGAVSEKYIL